MTDRESIVAHLLRRAVDHDRIADEQDIAGNVLTADGCRQIAAALRNEAESILHCCDRKVSP